jgi:hypothetical protein
MKNQDNFGFTQPQDESIWQLAKPSNPWTPNTDKAWQNLSMQLTTAAASASLISTAPIKTISKIALKKILLWSAVGASITAATVYQIKRGDEKPVSPTASNTSSSPKSSTPLADSLIMSEKATQLPADLKENSTDKIIVAPKSPESNTAPTSKILQFKQTELQVVAEILSQTYGVNVKIEKPQLLHCKLTATFENEPINIVLEIIQETFNMEIVPEKEIIWLKGGSCR